MNLWKMNLTMLIRAHFCFVKADGMIFVTHDSKFTAYSDVCSSDLNLFIFVDYHSFFFAGCNFDESYKEAYFIVGVEP